MSEPIDGLRLNPDLRWAVCNIEMPPAVLLDRQLARLSGIDAESIRYRRLDGRRLAGQDVIAPTVEQVGGGLEVGLSHHVAPVIR